VPCCVACGDVVVGGHWWLMVGVFKKKKKENRILLVSVDGVKDLKQQRLVGNGNGGGL
jgi:hypothetical protein